MKEERSIYVEHKKILLKTSQTEKDSENQKKLNISIYNYKIISNMCITNIFTKDVSMEIKCTDNIWYMVLMKVMYCLIKVFKKKEDEVSKNKKWKDGYINKGNYRVTYWSWITCKTLKGISTAKISTAWVGSGLQFC